MLLVHCELLPVHMPSVLIGPQPSFLTPQSPNTSPFSPPGHTHGHICTLPCTLPAPAHRVHTWTTHSLQSHGSSWTSPSLEHMPLGYRLHRSLGKEWSRPPLSPCISITAVTTNIYIWLHTSNYPKYLTCINSSNLTTDNQEVDFFIVSNNTDKGSEVQKDCRHALVSSSYTILNHPPLFFSPV